MDNRKIQNIKPFIFIKKINNKFKIIPLNVITNTLGPTRHFPSATKEWFNSVYAFNSNSIKNFNIADRNFIKLIKSYFNLYFNKRVLKSKRIVTRFRRLAVKKIFISKAELKHTSSKVIINLYIYNEERRVLIRKIKRLEAILFPLNSNERQSQISDKPFSLKEKLNIIKTQEDNVSLINWLYELNYYIVQQIELEEKNLLLTKKISEKNLIIEDLKKNYFQLKNIISICEKDSVSYKHYENLYKDFLFKTHLEKEINTIAYYKLLLNLNKSKFEDKFLSMIKPLVSKLYNKEVEFNIINLKTLFLNSDIFTEAISLKLKNRDNKLLRVLKSSLSMVKIPKVNRIREQYNKINIKELWVNKINNLNVNFISNNYFNKNNLNELLLDLFHNSSYLSNNDMKKNKENSNLLSNIVLNT
jgi:hypothetical protein